MPGPKRLYKDSDPVTDWFDASVPPMYVGVYQRGNPVGVRFSYWDGRQWYWSEQSADSACYMYYRRVQSSLMLPWRGLAQPPGSAA